MRHCRSKGRRPPPCLVSNLNGASHTPSITSWRAFGLSSQPCHGNQPGSRPFVHPVPGDHVRLRESQPCGRRDLEDHGRQRKWRPCDHRVLGVRGRLEESQPSGRHGLGGHATPSGSRPYGHLALEAHGPRQESSLPLRPSRAICVTLGTLQLHLAA